MLNSRQDGAFWLLLSLLFLFIHHGGVRHFHQKSICLHPINFRVFGGANLVTYPAGFTGNETLVHHRVAPTPRECKGPYFKCWVLNRNISKTICTRIRCSNLATEQLSPRMAPTARQTVYLSLLKWGVLQSRVARLEMSNKKLDKPFRGRCST